MRWCLAVFWFTLVVGLAHGAEAPLLLISCDGFRWDYPALYPAETGHLRALAQDGVAARGLIPVFPSNTFPNHYAIVTGLYPSHHGIVNNDMFDARSGMYFHYYQPNSVRDPQWWQGEPIWVTAVNQGRKSAASFWVGSEAAIGGVRPTFWRSYDYSVPFERRLEELVGWLKLPPEQRPAVVAFYFEETNSAGHAFGPESPEIRAAIKLIDARIGTMLARLQQERIEPNVVVVSDHGMTPVDPRKIMIIEDYLPDSAAVQIDFQGSVAGLRPLRGDAASLVRTLGRLPFAKAYLVEDLPAHLHVSAGPRVPPVWVLPEEGAQFVTRAVFKRNSSRPLSSGYVRGDHGYDPALPSMHGILIAHGPAFRRGVTLPDIANIDLYNLFCAILRLQPAANDGGHELAASALR
jgi:predicted AlkP superfamily pyrophosphatase or phosphodiesterase